MGKNICNNIWQKQDQVPSYIKISYKSILKDQCFNRKKKM